MSVSVLLACVVLAGLSALVLVARQPGKSSSWLERRQARRAVEQEAYVAALYADANRRLQEALRQLAKDFREE